MIFIASSFPFPKRAITELSLHNLIWPMTIITYCLIKIDNFSQKNIIYILLFNIQKLSRRIIKHTFFGEKGVLMKKVLSFIKCILPLILFFVTCIPLLQYSITEKTEFFSQVPDEILPILLFCLAILTVIAVYGVMIWLIVKTIKKQEMSTLAKVVWCICLYSFNIFVFPIYWFVYLRKE